MARLRSAVGTEAFDGPPCEPAQDRTNLDRSRPENERGAYAEIDAESTGCGALDSLSGGLDSRTGEKRNHTFEIAMI